MSQPNHNSPSPSANTDDGVAALAYLAAATWRFRRGLICGGTIGALMGAAWTFTRPDQFTASVVAMPPSAESKLGGLSALALTALPTLSLNSSHGSTQQIVAILESRHLQALLIDRAGLGDDYVSSSRDQRLEAFAEDFRVDHDPISGRILWSYRHRNPGKAAEVATLAGDLLQVRLQELTRSGIGAERAFLEGQLQLSSQRLQKAYSRRAEFLTANNVIDVDVQVRTTIEALADLQARRIVTDIELRAQRAAGAGEANAQQAYLSATIAEIDRELATYLDKSAHGGGGGLLLGLKDLPTVTITYLDLLREIKTQEAVTAQLVSQVESFRIQEARSVEGVTIVDPAMVPDSPSGPRRALSIAMASFLGALGGFLSSLALRSLKGRNPAEVHPSSQGDPTA